ncbi:nucleoside-triphosphatase [Halanaerobium saccharolyticum]|uniref:nucleoside-triphosphatase n=1 Tax=Halanaerobium saccharolyticum TaxID=43595 RepID=UPI003FCDE76A
MANNYLITGAKGVGKSTLLARLLQELDLKTAGFSVARINAADGKPLLFELRQAAELKEKGTEALKNQAPAEFSAAEKVKEDQAEAKRCQETFEIFNGAPETLSLSAAAGKSLKLLRYPKIFAYRENTEAKFTLKAEVFDNLGVELLRESAELIVMDELGRFELEADKFQKEVFSLLASEKIVIGVIKAEENPFLDKIRQRNDIEIYQLNEGDQEQRAVLLNKILENLKIYKQESE